MVRISRCCVYLFDLKSRAEVESPLIVSRVVRCIYICVCLCVYVSSEQLGCHHDQRNKNGFAVVLYVNIGGRA